MGTTLGTTATRWCLMEIVGIGRKGRRGRVTKEKGRGDWREERWREERWREEKWREEKWREERWREEMWRGEIRRGEIQRREIWRGEIHRRERRWKRKTCYVSWEQRGVGELVVCSDDEITLECYRLCDPHLNASKS